MAGAAGAAAGDASAVPGAAAADQDAADTANMAASAQPVYTPPAAVGTGPQDTAATAPAPRNSAVAGGHASYAAVVEGEEAAGSDGVGGGLRLGLRAGGCCAARRRSGRCAGWEGWRWGSGRRSSQGGAVGLGDRAFGWGAGVVVVVGAVVGEGRPS